MTTRVKTIITAGETLTDIVRGDEYAGGAPLNVACAAARLGSRAIILSRIGNDARGRLILDAGATAGVCANGFQVDANAPTRGVVVAHDAAGERTFAGFSGAPPFADELLDAHGIGVAPFADAAWFACGSPALAAVQSRAALARCMEYCRIRAVPIAVDVNRRDIFWREPQASRALIESMLLEEAAVLKATKDEAFWLFGTGDADRVCAALPSAKLVVVTDGERGGSYATRGSSGNWPAFAVECDDSTGAGDAFLGALLHFLDVADAGDEARLRAALTAASAAGALATRAAGALAAQPSSDVLRAFLGSRGPEIVDGDAG